MGSKVLNGGLAAIVLATLCLSVPAFAQSDAMHHHMMHRMMRHEMHREMHHRMMRHEMHREMRHRMMHHNM